MNMIFKNIIHQSDDVEGLFGVELINDPFEEEFRFNVKKCAVKEAAKSFGK